jgi:hypothetical protein
MSKRSRDWTPRPVRGWCPRVLRLPPPRFKGWTGGAIRALASSAPVWVPLAHHLARAALASEGA